MKPKEIRLYLTDEDKEVFEWHQKHVESRLSRFLNDGQIRLFYVKDVGPSTKFVYAIRDMLEQDRANQAIIVLGRRVEQCCHMLG